MRTILFFLFMILCFTTFAQDSSYLGRKAKMKMNYKATICDAVGDCTSNSGTSILEIKSKVIIVAFIGEDYVVSKSNENPPTYYLIKGDKFNSVIKPPSWSFTVGIPTIPVKLRFGNGGVGENPRYFRFDGNINLGLSMGLKYSFGRKRQYAINGVFGFTSASVQLDSSTTKGNTYSPTSVPSFSPHVGVVMGIQDFQFGIYAGRDFLYGESNKYWVYKNKTWLGIGIGYNLFSIATSK